MRVTDGRTDRITTPKTTLAHARAVERKVIGRTPKGYISPIWGEAPSNPIVTKYGLWVPLPDVINCAKFHLCHTNSFRVAGPRKFGVPIDLKGDLYNS